MWCCVNVLSSEFWQRTDAASYSKRAELSTSQVFLKLYPQICKKPIDLILRHERINDFDWHDSCFDWSNWIFLIRLILEQSSWEFFDPILCTDFSMLHCETRRIVDWYFISDIYITVFIRRVRNFYFIEQQTFLTTHSLHNNMCISSHCNPPPSFTTVLIFKLWRTWIVILVFILFNG